MRAAHDEFLTLRLPRELRADLTAAAGGGRRDVSATARRALVAGLAVIRSGSLDREPPPVPPAAPAGALPRAA